MPARLADWPTWVATDYQKMKGIGRSKGRRLATMTEIARQMMNPWRGGSPLMNRADFVAEIFQTHRDRTGER